MNQHIRKILSFISGDIRALEAIWFVGDAFLDWSFTESYKHLRHEEEKFYIPELYDIHDFASTKYKSNIHNVLARIRSQLYVAIKQEKVLPKVIVFVLDDDVVQQIHFNDFGLTEVYADICKYFAA